MIDVFFYGLFMNENLLEEKGLNPANPRKGYVDGFGLRIGERATLVSAVGERAYGVVMSLTDEEVTDLYSEESVADYVPEAVIVVLDSGAAVEATCYNLPAKLLMGSNRTYAKSLLRVAANQGFPHHYLETIKQLGGESDA